MFEVSQQELVDELAEGLKDRIEKPDWSKFVKTGVHKERPPVDEDWWYVRAASVLRQVELKGPIGVSKLRYKYGGRKNNGMAPEHFYKGSGKIIRTILQQLEEAKLVKQEQKGSHKGRVTTSEGKSLIFQTADNMEKGKKKADKKEKKSKKDEQSAGSKASSEKDDSKGSADEGSSDKKDSKKKSKDEKDDSGDNDGEE